MLTVRRKWLMSTIVLVGLAFFTMKASADEGATTTAASFLKIGVGSRPQAMGGAQVADPRGGLALFWNPAGLGQGRGRNLLFSYNRYRFDISQGLVAFSGKIGPKGGFGFGANYLGVGGIEVRSDATDQPEGTTQAWGLALYAGYGRTLFGNLSLGLAGKFIQEKLHEDKASAFAFDVGMGYGYKNLSFGAAVQNLSQGLEFRKEKFRLPTTVRVGAALFFLDRTLTVAADIEQPLFGRSERRLHFGAELALKDLLSFRGGYNYHPRNSEFGTVTGLTAGVGIDYGGWEIGYTFAPSENLGDVHQISVSIDLERPTGPRPPFIEIISPKDRGVTDKEFIDLLGNITDDKAIAGYEIWVNRNMIRFEDVRGISGITPSKRQKKLRFSRKISLDQGSNIIKVVAYDADNLSTTKSIIVERIRAIAEEIRRGNTYALIVGISEYENDYVGDLKYTAADARAFEQFLRSRQGGDIPKENIRLLINEEATKENIKSALWDWLPVKANQKRDRVIIFYAGHGIVYRNKGFFVTCRSDPDRWGGTALPMDDVNAAFDMIEAGQILFFSDACHSGVVTEPMRIAQRGKNLDSYYMINRFSGVGRVMVTASKGNENSIELDDYGHGLFTYFLLEGLKGEADRRANGGNQDGWVDIDEVYNYTYDKVSDRAAELGLLQHPQQEKRVEGKIYLSRVR